MVKPIPWDMPESLIDSEGVRARSTISAIPRLNTVPVARPNRIAIQTAQSLDPNKVGAEIYKGSYQGVAGTYAYDENGNLKQAPITVLTFKNAAPTPLASY